MAKRKPGKSQSGDATSARVERVPWRDLLTKIAQQQTRKPNAPSAPPTATDVEAVYELAEFAIGSVWAMRECLRGEQSRLSEVFFLLADVAEKLATNPHVERVRGLVPPHEVRLVGVIATTTRLNVALDFLRQTGQIFDLAVRAWPWPSENDACPQFWQMVRQGLDCLPAFNLRAFIDDLRHEKSFARVALQATADTGWSDYDTPQRWAKKIKLSWKSIKRRIDEGTMTAEFDSSKWVRFRRDCLPERAR